MKTTLRKTIAFLSMLALTLVMGVSTVQAGEFEDALSQLEHAKWSEKDWHVEHAIEHLESAKHHLEEANRSHHGERREAIHQIDEALHAAHAKEFRRINEHIDLAIRDVRAGMH